MAIPSSILAWKIPWTEARLAAVHGSQRAGHNRATEQQQQQIYTLMEFDLEEREKRWGPEWVVGTWLLWV